MSAELIIAVENDGRSLQARHADGRTARGVLRGFDHDSLTRRTIRLFERWMRADKFCDSKEIAVFGQHLYQLLFDVEIERLFEEALRQAQADGERLRLQLSFEAGAAELANLPWEFLHYPRENCFLCSRTDIVLSRFMPRHARKTLRTEGTLRLLIAVSKPSDLGPVLEPRVIESIQRLSEAYPVQVDVLRETTVAAFTERMRTFKPHVLHFIGHGNFDVETSSGQIALLKADGTADWCSDSDFADWCSLSELPRVVFLHLCEGGRADLRDSFGGLAPRLVQKGVQAVVAMQYPITNMAAIDFSRVFYQALADGEPLDYAVQRGRQALMTMRQHAARAFGTPTLYLHSVDGLLQPADRAAVRPTDQLSNNALTPEDLLIGVRPHLERIADENYRRIARQFAVQVVERLELLRPEQWLAHLKREWRVQFNSDGTPEQLDLLEAMMTLIKERGV
jgi:hypothetical protein